mmetsp:Transcript_19119/g.41113  ORF Transcript_19119/g.41113 Transcript_19119/m.41113 type:complete len:227 (+) Transcript_19119:505-1185(+)
MVLAHRQVHRTTRLVLHLVLLHSDRPHQEVKMATKIVPSVPVETNGTLRTKSGKRQWMHILQTPNRADQATRTIHTVPDDEIGIHKTRSWGRQWTHIPQTRTPRTPSPATKTIPIVREDVTGTRKIRLEAHHRTVSNRSKAAEELHETFVICKTKIRPGNASPGHQGRLHFPKKNLWMRVEALPRATTSILRMMMPRTANERPAQLQWDCRRNNHERFARKKSLLM